jgi:DASS family divalent anion:Na+ symporter
MSPAGGLLVKRGVSVLLFLGIWFAPVPAGLTREAWHLFAIFVSAIVSVILAAFPLLTAAMLAVALTVVTGTVAACQGLRGLRQRQRAPRRGGLHRGARGW